MILNLLVRLWCWALGSGRGQDKSPNILYWQPEKYFFFLLLSCIRYTLHLLMCADHHVGRWFGKSHHNTPPAFKGLPHVFSQPFFVQSWSTCPDVAGKTPEITLLRVTCYMSLTPTAKATDLPPANFFTLHSKILSGWSKKTIFLITFF